MRNNVEYVKPRTPEQQQQNYFLVLSNTHRHTGKHRHTDKRTQDQLLWLHDDK